MSETNQIVEKIAEQENPKIVFSDIDGTLFSPNANILLAPLSNLQTAAYIKARHIPFIIVTGRSFWRRIDQYHLTLLGLPKPDAVITANGTIIYYLEKDSYVSDFLWQSHMQSTKVTDSEGHISSWNKWEITNRVVAYLQEQHIPFHLGQGNTYLIRIRCNKFSIAQIEEIRKNILRLFPKGIGVVMQEKLLWENTDKIFSGELLITPSTAGKEKAIQYMLKTLAIELQNHSQSVILGSETTPESILRQAQDKNRSFGMYQKSVRPFDKTQDERIKKIHAFIFGDASVDLGMLTMKSDEKYYSLAQYGVHPTPLAYKALQQHMKINSRLHILPGDGPKEILWTLRPELKKSLVSSRQSLAKDQRPKTKDQFSPAQNNKARQLIQRFEPLLDRLVDKKLSANDVSFLGIRKLSEGLTLLHKPKGSLLDKTKGLFDYSFGNLTDVLDGIRSRRQKTEDRRQIEEPGHLVDGFSDRAKEFMQLYARGQKRLEEYYTPDVLGPSTSGVDENAALQTFLAAISCCLPSIAREQAEITGVAVPEKDEMGGSMIDRTRRLFISLLFDSFGLSNKSLAKDEEILEKNIATFRHRLTYSSSAERSIKDSSHFIRTIKLDNMSEFQKTGLEKFLLYVDCLQQENTIITKTLSQYPSLLKQYNKNTNILVKDYLALPINKLRKKFGIKDWNLKINDYLSK